MKKSTKLWLIVLLIWSLSPLIWQLYSSFCTTDVLIKPFEIHSNRWTLDNYKQILNADIGFSKYIINSTIVGISTTFLTILIAIPGSYSLARLPVKIHNLTRSLILIAALSPYVLLFLALLEMARKFNLANNLILLSLPYSALSLPLALLLLASAFKDIPKELEEASRIEGLSSFQTVRFILLPLIKPSIASTAILVFLFSWNEYPIALSWLSNPEALTLPVAIARLAGSSIYSVPYGAYAAATVLGSIPLLLIVLIFQRQIVSGLTNGAIKG